MNIFINTAYENIEIFIFNQNKSNLYEIKSINNHTKCLYELFYKVLDYEKITMNDIDNIYIVNGPGSFTGLRVGVIFAKTLAYELNIKIIPVNLLKILYLTLNKNIAIDARGNKFFCYDGQNFTLKTKEEIIKEKIEISHKINYSRLEENLGHFESKNVLDIIVDYKKEVL